MTSQEGYLGLVLFVIAVVITLFILFFVGYLFVGAF